MKILLVADLHSNRRWYEWLVEQARHYHLVSVAGDLIDVFAADERGQIDYLRSTWLPAMIATRVPVAISSGNHDGSAVLWLSYLSQIEGVVGDGCTKLVGTPSGEQIVVSTIPYYRSFQQHDPETHAGWEKGARLRASENLPWIVLHHEPPTALSEGKTITTHWLASHVEQYQPDFISCGHFHGGAEKSFAHRIGASWCFNSGQRLDAPEPNHIVLDTMAGTATRLRMKSLAHSISWSLEESVTNL